MKKILIISFLLIQGIVAAQRPKAIQGNWYAGKTLMDPKVGKIIMTRVGHNGFDHGTFLWVKDTLNMELYYSPMCGNDCIWNYQGVYSFKSNKLSLKFNSYSQHGFCKKISKTYNKSQMKFVFSVEEKGKDTLILTRIAK